MVYMPLHSAIPYTIAVMWPGDGVGRIFLKGYESKLGKLNVKSETLSF